MSFFPLSLRTRQLLSLLAACLCLLGLIFFARRTNYAVPQTDTYEEDVYYAYLEGSRINNGDNPYMRILNQDMLRNNKYSTYFPLFYEVSFLSIRYGGLERFVDWIRVWRQVFHGFEYAIAVLLFAVLARRGLEWGGVAAAGFWLFNRWTMYIIITANLEFIPIFFMLAGFVLYPKKEKLGLILFSISLALKQIGIFVAPLFVMWAFFAAGGKGKGLLNAGKTAALVASVPLLASLPFLFWNLEGFVRSILFSATRLPASHLWVSSVDALMGWTGPLTRIPMLALYLSVYGLAAKGIGGKYLPAALIFTIFIGFNPVLYNQYFIWWIPFLPLIVADFSKGSAGGFFAAKPAQS